MLSDCDFCNQNRISVGLSRRGSEFSGADGTDGKYEHGKICRYVWISYRVEGNALRTVKWKERGAMGGIALRDINKM